MNPHGCTSAGHGVHTNQCSQILSSANNGAHDIAHWLREALFAAGGKGLFRWNEAVPWSRGLIDGGH